MLVEIRLAKVGTAHRDRLCESPDRDSYIMDRFGAARSDGALDLTRKVFQLNPRLIDGILPGVLRNMRYTHYSHYCHIGSFVAVDISRVVLIN